MPIHVHMHTSWYMPIPLYIHTSSYYIYMLISLCIYIFLYMHISTYMHIPLYIHISLHMQTYLQRHILSANTVVFTTHSAESAANLWKCNRFYDPGPFLPHRSFGPSPIRPNIAHSAPIITHSAQISPIRPKHRLFGGWISYDHFFLRGWMGYRPFGQRRSFGQIITHSAKSSPPLVRKRRGRVAHSAKNIAHAE